MLWLMCLMIGMADERPVPLSDTLQELIYQAEVYGRHRESLESLRSLVAKADPADRPGIIRALALVKYKHPRPLYREKLLVALQTPRAVITRNGLLYLMTEDTWLEAGDWIGSNFLLGVDRTKVILENKEGFQQQITFFQPFEKIPEDNQCLLRDAPTSTLLHFVSRQASLNNFSPSEFDTPLSGTFAVVDWLSLMDMLCRQARVVWTRRGDSVIFTYHPQNQVSKQSVHTTLDRKNLDLRTFFKWLEDTVDLEVMTDVSADDLATIRVDIYAQDQTWDETLDCLAVMNGFSWALVEDEEKTKILLTRDPYSDK